MYTHKMLFQYVIELTKTYTNFQLYGREYWVLVVTQPRAENVPQYKTTNNNYVLMRIHNVRNDFVLFDM